jgi:hypothetical protein
VSTNRSTVSCVSTKLSHIEGGRDNTAVDALWGSRWIVTTTCILRGGLLTPLGP